MPSSFPNSALSTLCIPLGDTITPGMMNNLMYLFVMNAAIGVLEGLLLKWWFAGGKRAVWWMIAANYCSAWLGWFLLGWLIDPSNYNLGPKPIERISHLALIVTLISFAITILLEAGFVHIAIRREKRSVPRTLLATITVNAISYTILCSWYLSTSFTLLTDARVVDFSQMSQLPRATLYWVDPSGLVRSRNFARSEPDHIVVVLPQNETYKPYQLRITESDNSHRAQMNAEYETIGAGNIPAGMTPGVQEMPVLLDAGPLEVFPADYWQQSRILLKSVLDLRPEKSRQIAVNFDVYRHFLHTEVPGGLNSMLSVAFASLEWEPRQPTVLPDDKIIFEWEGQVVLFDPRTQNIAFVALGSCPAFIPDAK